LYNWRVLNFSETSQLGIPFAGKWLW